MSPEFAAAVCDGFCGSLEELLSRDLPPMAQNILSSLQNKTEAAIEALRELREPAGRLLDQPRSD